MGLLSTYLANRRLKKVLAEHKRPLPPIDRFIDHFFQFLGFMPVLLVVLFVVESLFLLVWGKKDETRWTPAKRHGNSATPGDRKKDGGS